MNIETSTKENDAVTNTSSTEFSTETKGFPNTSKAQSKFFIKILF